MSVSQLVIVTQKCFAKSVLLKVCAFSFVGFLFFKQRGWGFET